MIIPFQGDVIGGAILQNDVADIVVIGGAILQNDVADIVVTHIDNGGYAQDHGGPWGTNVGHAGGLGFLVPFKFGFHNCGGHGWQEDVF